MGERVLLNILNRFNRAIHENYYKDLGIIELWENDNLELFKFKVIPNEGFHKDKPYFITCKFNKNDLNNWPLVYLDSEIFDIFKTKQYIENKGKKGIHKGICIKNLSYCYGFYKNFKKICDNNWNIYFFYIITVFNNIQDFGKGNGFRHNFMDLIHEDL